MATVAFGLGLDSPNVRHVIHWRPPEDLELYVQESDRGGRDRTATLFYGKKDIAATTKESVLSSSFLGQEGQTTTPAPQSVQMMLKEELITFRANLSSQNHATALVGIEMCTGLTDQAIESITTNFIVRVIF